MKTATINLSTLEVLAINALSMSKVRGDEQWGAAWAYRDVADRLFGDDARDLSRRMWEMADERLPQRFTKNEAIKIDEYDHNGRTSVIVSARDFEEVKVWVGPERQPIDAFVFSNDGFSSYNRAVGALKRHLLKEGHGYPDNQLFVIHRNRFGRFDVYASYLPTNDTQGKLEAIACTK